MQPQPNRLVCLKHLSVQQQSSRTLSYSCWHCPESLGKSGKYLALQIACKPLVTYRVLLLILFILLLSYGSEFLKHLIRLSWMLSVYPCAKALHATWSVLNPDHHFRLYCIKASASCFANGNLTLMDGYNTFRDVAKIVCLVWPKH